jgi:putative Ca2+/H+ antiporter (TMEM165/GDT1 family)
MSLRVIASTFIAIFFAELGDKTQLATLSMASGSTSRWSVFAGSALALVTSSAVAVLAGDALGQIVSPIWLRRIAGAAFLVLGVLYLFSRGEG